MINKMRDVQAVHSKGWEMQYKKQAEMQVTKESCNSYKRKQIKNSLENLS